MRLRAAKAGDGKHKNISEVDEGAGLHAINLRTLLVIVQKEFAQLYLLILETLQCAREFPMDHV